MVLKLFDGSDDDGAGDTPYIQIDKDFARRYEHNKKREDLHRLEELHKKGLVDSSCSGDSDSSSDEDSGRHDADFFNALIRIRNQDPALKDAQVKLFDSGSEPESRSEPDEQNVREKKRRPMYLKDVTAKHLIEGGPEFEEKEEIKTYSEEQEELRRAFLEAVEADGNDGDIGDLLKEKERPGQDNDDEDDNVEMKKKLDEYFGEDDKLDENDKFLKDYFRNKMWLGEDRGVEGEEVKEFGISEDDEEIERQEDYEREFNFRFEENAGDRVMGHSRFVEGSVRKKPNARKLQRRSKEERMVQSEFERKEELKHLKNLKKKEMNDKLRRIRETAGIGEDGVCLLDEGDLEEEFDSEEHDRKMREAFDDSYYGANDADPDFGSDSDADEDGELEKPNFDKEDEWVGLPKGNGVYGSRDGFLAAREKTLKKRGVDSGGNAGEANGKKGVHEEGKGKKKRERSGLEKEVLKEDLEEYYKLDYEDTIGDLKTRFKYKPVNARRYGVSAEEVLELDDKELNQYVSLKKLAPYREQEWKVPRIQRYNQKQRIKSLLQGDLSIRQIAGRKKSREDHKRSVSMVADTNIEKWKPDQSNEDAEGQSKRSKRRRRQAKLKLPHSRLMAYGKIPSKSKSKMKHQKLPVEQSNTK
ncbi:hypothetical protein RJ639_018086 [Escallonia herrerae]|uniref:Kri1-like C-terminal domain-containing protein n=1 Tax=Escallonia herrerae TaxID=1293975 RepID=A0AA89AI75_9ASTE|nr:hypothetical protein RJ639_018086 [Escallonia herrerae]